MGQQTYSDLPSGAQVISGSTPQAAAGGYSDLPPGAQVVAGSSSASPTQNLSLSVPDPNLPSVQAHVAHPVRDWLENAEADIRYGGNRTIVGQILHPGATQLNPAGSGTAPIGNSGAANILAGPAVGPLNVAGGVANVIAPTEPNENFYALKRRMRGTNQAVSGLVQTASLPLSVLAPGGSAIPKALPYIGVQKGISSLVSALGGDPTTSEFFGNAAAFRLGPTAGAIAENPAALAKALRIKVMPDSSLTPTELLTKALRPKDVAPVHDALDTADAVNRIQSAATNSGIGATEDNPLSGGKISSADNLIDAVKQAKLERLQEASSNLPEGQTLNDLPPEDAASLTHDLATLDHVQRRIEVLQNQEANPSFLNRAVSGASAIGKYTLQRALGKVVPFGGRIAAAGMRVAGVDSAFSDLTNAIGGGGSSLDSAVERAFRDSAPNNTQTAANNAVSDAQGAAPVDPFAGGQPFTGDLGVANKSSIFPPSQPGGDALVVDANGNRQPVWQGAGIQPGQPPVQEPQTLFPATSRTAQPQNQRPAPVAPPARVPLWKQAQNAAQARQDLISRIAAINPNADLSGLGDPFAATGANNFPSNPQSLADMAEAMPANIASDIGHDVGTGASRNNPLANIRKQQPLSNVSTPTLDAFTGSVTPNPNFRFSAPTGEGAALEQLSSEPISNLKKIAQARGIQFDGSLPDADLTQGLVHSIVSDMVAKDDPGLQLFEDHVFQQNRFSSRRGGPDTGNNGGNGGAPPNGSAPIAPMSGNDLIAALQQMAAKKAAANPALPGMQPAIDAQRVAAGVQQAQDMSGQVASTAGNISGAAGDLERNSPLFSGSGASGQGSIFQSMQDALAQPQDQRAIPRDPNSAQSIRISVLRKDMAATSDPLERAQIQQAIDRETAIANGQTPAPLTPQAVSENLPADRPADAYQPPDFKAEGKGPISQQTVPPSSLKPGDVAFVNPQDMKLDPSRFQFKHNVNEKGVTNQFADVGKFDEGLAGVVDAFKDPATGELHPVNGHHRTVLAQDLNAPRMLVNVMDTTDPVEARARGALKNLVEGKGTGFDAAVFLRDSNLTPQDLSGMGISLSDAKVNNALALKNLSPEILDKVGNGTLDEGRAISIGQATSDPDIQRQVIQQIQNREKNGKTIPNDVVASLAKDFANAPNYESQSLNLFGPTTETKSLAIEKAQVDAGILRNFKGEKNTFGAVKSDSKAAQLGKAGNVINTGENARISNEAAQNIEAYNRLAYRAGEINRIKETAAMEISLGQDSGQVISRATQEVRSILDRELGRTPNAGNSGSGDVAR